ncbi:MAG: response regulator [Pseudomonadota bacterium]
MAEIKVLVVDDEVEFASALAERLELRNFSCRVCHGGVAALEEMKGNIPDVVVLDLKMPDMSGLDVLAVIKEKNPGIEVLMLTGHGSAASGVRGMEQGAFDYMMKPVDIGELVHKIKLAGEKSRSTTGVR